jgi:hypothetical protein
MLNLPVRPKKKRAKRNNRISKTGYFTDEGVEKLAQLANFMNRSESDTLCVLVDLKHAELIGGGRS